MRPTNRPRKRVITGFGIGLLFVLGFALFMHENFQIVQVSGDSMLPNLPNGTRVLVTQAYWLVGGLRDNDVVVVQGGSPNEFIIKRVKALAGETVDFENVPDSHPLGAGDYVVPQGMIYVLGDNLKVSEDSRSLGPFSLSKVIGKVVVAPR
ncbi:MAG: hypothetical protein HY248_05995 [Fimbriimonas ginsengisoli]|nr:hypothetical protein [Fimbriimonas ginsengisoli]